MRTMTKVGISCFVCLSVFMSACAITRAAGTYYKGSLDYPWQDFWLHTEGCIGVMMGSITAYRSTLVGSDESPGRFRVYMDKIKRSFRRTSSGDSPEMTETKPATQTNRFGLPRIPGGVISGVRTWFDLRSTQKVSLHSEASMDADYHAFLKEPQPRAVAGKYPVGMEHSLELTVLEPQATPALTRGPREDPGGFARFVLMVLGYEVLLQHRSIGDGRIRTERTDYDRTR